MTQHVNHNPFTLGIQCIWVVYFFQPNSYQPHSTNRKSTSRLELIHEPPPPTPKLMLHIQ